MRLAAKLVLIFMLGVFAIVGLFSWQSIQRQQQWLQTQHERHAVNLVEALTPALAQAYREGGMVEVQRTLEITAQQVHGPAMRLMEPRALSSKSPKLLARETIQISVAGPQDAAQTSYVPLVLEGEPQGAVEVKQPASEFRDNYRNTLTASLISLVGVALLSAAVILIGGIRLVGKPLDALVAQMAQIGDGELDQEPTVRSNDELGKLSMAICNLAYRLRQQRATIEREMESRVRAEQHLRHADRLTTIGTLASGIGHELGTPLNVVAGHAGLIASGKLTANEIPKSALAIKSEAERMTNIIRQLLDFARRSPAVHAQLDFRQLVQSTCELMRPLADRKQVELVLLCQTSKIDVMGDSAQLKQVITNLLSNAIQASPSQSQVTLELADHEQELPPTVSREYDYLALRIRDTGDGISPEYVERVFEPFFTTKDVGEGTGLGLSIAYGIIREHDGWIHVTSALGAGTTFTVCLPRIKPNEPNHRKERS